MVLSDWLSSFKIIHDLLVTTELHLHIEGENVCCKWCKSVVISLVAASLASSCEMFS
jgi:hypothetical protein